MSRRRTPNISTTQEKMNAVEAAEQIQIACDRLIQPSEAQILAAKHATQERREKLQQTIQTLHPGICANVVPFLFMATLWILWSIVAPLALLLFVRSNPDHDNADAMWGLGWSFLGTGGAYLVWHLIPILTQGGCCMPRAPKKDGPLLKKDLDRHDIVEKVVAKAPADASSSPSAPPTLHPQAPVIHDVAGKCVYILLNSHGQHGAVATEKAQACSDALNKKKCCVHLIHTQYAGHLEDLGRDPILLPLSSPPGGACASCSSSSPPPSSSSFSPVAAILIVGGDGSFSEFVNGYMKRCIALEIPPEERTPLGLIPAGTGNSLARDIYSDDLSIDASLASILSGHVARVDVSSIKDQGGLDMYSTNVISFGLVGDTAVVAEDYRALGDLRYDLCAVWFVMRKVTSSARFVLEGLGGDYNTRRGKGLDWGKNANLVVNQPASNGNHRRHTRRTDASSPYSRQSIELYGRKTTAFFNQTSHFGKALRACPHARLDDGLLDVVLGEEASRTSLLTMFQQLPKGSHLGNAAISHFQVQRVQMTRWTKEQTEKCEQADEMTVEEISHMVDSSQDRYVINVDGENIVVQGTVRVESLLRQIPMFLPAVAFTTKLATPRSAAGNENGDENGGASAGTVTIRTS